MANFIDMRPAGDDDTDVRLEAYLNKDGDIILNLNEGEGTNPTMYLRMSLLEAKQLRQRLLETINEAVAELQYER